MRKPVKRYPEEEDLSILTDPDTSKLRIRYLADRPDVLPRVAGWIYDEWSFLYPGRSIEYIESLLRRRIHRNRLPFTLVAFMCGVPVGTVSLKKFDMDTRRNFSPWVTSLYVLKQWRKKGIAACMMNALEEKASEMRFPSLFLFTTRELAPFYLKLGWKIVEEPIYRSYEVVIMRKMIEPWARISKKCPSLL